MPVGRPRKYHSTEERTAARKAAAKARYLANREQIIAQSLKYYYDHKEHVAEQTFRVYWSKAPRITKLVEGIERGFQRIGEDARFKYAKRLLNSRNADVKAAISTPRLDYYWIADYAGV